MDDHGTQSKVTRRKVITKDGTPVYEIVRGGIVLGIAAMNGRAGVDNYPWDWHLQVDNPHARRSTGTTDTLRDSVDQIVRWADARPDTKAVI